MFRLGENIGTETLNLEFKELCLQNLHLYFSHEDIMNFLYHNHKLSHTHLNRMILNDLNYYINKYVPKYIGNFSKAGIKGDLYIGIDDMGFVEGIPFYGKLKSSLVKKMFLNAMTQSRGIKIITNVDNDTEQILDSDVVLWYYQNLNIKIIKLDTFDDIDQLEFDHTQSMTNLAKLEKKNKKIIDRWKKHRIDYQDWHNNLSKYSGKLLNYLIDPHIKANLIEYIKNDFEQNLTLNKSYLEPILDFYSYDTTYYQDLTFSLDYIESIITNSYSPILWLIKYKDIMCQKFKKLKPTHPGSKHDKKLYYKYANNVSNIRSHLIKSSSASDINFYLIKIEIPNMPNTYLEYKHLNRWVSKTRIIIDSGPSCA